MSYPDDIHWMLGITKDEAGAYAVLVSMSDKAVAATLPDAVAGVTLGKRQPYEVAQPFGTAAAH